MTPQQHDEWFREKAIQIGCALRNLNIDPSTVGIVALDREADQLVIKTYRPGLMIGIKCKTIQAITERVGCRVKIVEDTGPLSWMFHDPKDDELYDDGGVDLFDFKSIPRPDEFPDPYEDDPFGEPPNDNHYSNLPPFRG